VTPLANEDIAIPCHTDVTIAAPERVVSAVWIIYDRGRDVHNFYSDPSVVPFARRFTLLCYYTGIARAKNRRTVATRTWAQAMGSNECCSRH
jgi:hypothetical protein